jgi:peptidoglycan hydrolase-like protein with peptidoglycan-binding domain
MTRRSVPAEDKPRPLMQAQVVLDRLGFTPGVVDGKMGLSTVNAIKGFQEARGMTVTGKLDEPTIQALSQWKQIPATRVVTIPAEFANDSYVQIPEDRKLQAKMERLGYTSLAEKLAERFHTTEAVWLSSTRN